jgi:hypothetical protein
MATYTKAKLSGSTNGRGILVGLIATPGTLVHTAVTGTSDLDEIWLYATNETSTAIELALEWGGVTDPNDNITVTIPAESGLYLVSPGLLLQNSLVVRAYADTASGIVMHGFVNRIAA